MVDPVNMLVDGVEVELVGIVGRVVVVELVGGVIAVVVGPVGTVPGDVVEGLQDGVGGGHIVNS